MIALSIANRASQLRCSKTKRCAVAVVDAVVLRDGGYFGPPPLTRRLVGLTCMPLDLFMLLMKFHPAGQDYLPLHGWVQRKPSIAIATAVLMALG